jgi:exosortase B
VASVPHTSNSFSKQALARWLPVVVGIIALYSPTFLYSWNVVWSQDDYAYGPLILIVCCWMLWRDRDQLLNTVEPERASAWAWLVFGLVLFIVGRSQGIYIFELGSLSLVLAGALVVVSGPKSLRLARFPLLFMLFMLPLPNPLVDAVTGPLKQIVSVFAQTILYHAGYPIARSGVLLMIDQYQLLVADACSGLHSMFSLTALGVLYMHMQGKREWWRNAILLSCILPIAFFANVVRVMVLVLITYYFGDAAGQGFAHGFAGMVLFMVALLMLTGLDRIVSIIWPAPSAKADS